MSHFMMIKNVPVELATRHSYCMLIKTKSNNEL